MLSPNKNMRIATRDDHEVRDVMLGDRETEVHAMTFQFDRRWFNFMWIFISIAFIGLFARVFYVSVLNHESYAYSASDNVLRETPIIAPRGKISAKDGEILAENEPNYSLIISVQGLPAGDEMAEESFKENIKDLSQKFTVPEDFIELSITEARTSGHDVLIKENIPREIAITFEADDDRPQGFEIQKNASRIYPKGEIFAHIIGYEGLIQKEDFEQKREDGYLLTDRIGKTGLEKYYEDVLHGSHGTEKKIVDARERNIRILQKIEPKAGQNIHTHIDAALQGKITSRLQEELERAQSKRAAAVAIDPRSGAVRALVSLPLYDNNAFVHGIDSALYSSWITDEDRPLFNRAIAGVYPPGSTVKPMLGIATIEEGIVSPEYQIESKGGISVGRSFFGDWRVHGFTDLRRAIAVSSDVYFYTIGGGYGSVRGLGIERMGKWMRSFGFGEKTGIDLPVEVAGIYPTPEYKKDAVGERWYVGDTYNTSIGQGFVSATPLQVTNAIAAIANGGTLYTPHVVDYFESPEGEKKYVEPEKRVRQIGSERANTIVREGMRQTVTNGTGRLLQSVPVAVAGKTGTAQFYADDEKVHSWFVGYAPYEEPELVLLVLIEGQSGKISSATLPVVRDVFKWHFGERLVGSEAKGGDTNVKNQ